MTATPLPILTGDVSSLARRLLATARPNRRIEADSVVGNAAVAARHVRRTGALHPHFGNGTIMAAARSGCPQLPPEPRFDDLDYIECWIIALEAIRRHIVAAAEIPVGGHHLPSHSGRSPVGAAGTSSRPSSPAGPSASPRDQWIRDNMPEGAK